MNIWSVFFLFFFILFYFFVHTYVHTLQIREGGGGERVEFIRV